jgi:hypothetical protein
MIDQETQQRIDGFIDKYSADIAEQTREIVAKMRARLPGAVELIYDNYNALVFGYGPTERPSEAIVSIAVMPRWVDLCFIQNAPELPDPDGILLGSGKMARHIMLKSPDSLDEPAVQAILETALDRAGVKIDPSNPSLTVIRSISAKQRPRRK